MKNVIMMRTADDVEALYSELKRKKNPKVLIVGSSFIGMEAAAILVKESESVTVIGMEKTPFERVLGADIGKAMQRFHESKGVKFRMSTQIKSFESGEDGLCKYAVVGNEKIECDVVILGAGVVPNTQLLEKHFELDKDKGITVDRFMNVPKFERVFAAGDIARYPYHLSNGTENPLVRIEHWNVAIQQGKVAGFGMLGKQEPLDIVPFFWTAQFGKNIRYCGHAEDYDEVIFDGDPESLNFVAYYSKNDVIVGVSSLGRDPVVAHCSELIRLGRMPSAKVIKTDPKIVMATPLEMYTPRNSL